MPKTHSAAAIEIGRRIRDVRLQLGISLEDLGELAEIGATSIGRIERGVSSPAVETIIRIAAALEVEPGQFLSGISPDDYGAREHKFTVRDLIKGRDGSHQARA
ncbi:helix-turn-helix transcriptional regulator [Leucobacter insecticola]|uniref:Helix-turn-helix transcriptional regulator n=1 Tax=Leucobacter insecticola TaxID=2714934 RepID=A0A6G8FH82_9MICO|nr:helix-turn-helix transcriptional regulator [Leucobacter insecticola]QIM15392.1 helix-turn-helix transcriptional regulator [Leucobacter insecticola]